MPKLGLCNNKFYNIILLKNIINIIAILVTVLFVIKN